MARGRMESWQKWSFPCRLRRQGWRRPSRRSVCKWQRISQFSLAGGRGVAARPGAGRRAGCEVELTEVRTRGEGWWTLGFEATDPGDLLRGQLEATAALVLAQAVPDVEPGTDDPRSLAEWLCQQPGTASDVTA